nr:type I restriction-modification system subunit M N-terminal domain-containing protein [Fibrobacter succinogenes]
MARTAKKNAAYELWGHIPAAEYRKIFTGLIFLRYISAAFEKRYNELVAKGEGFKNEPDEYTQENEFFVPPNL